MKLGEGTVHGSAGLMAWVVLAGPGRFWPDLAGPGRTWPDLAGPGRTRVAGGMHRGRVRLEV